MLEILTLAAAFGLLLYGGYAAYWLVPRDHPLEAISLNVMCVVIGMIGVAPWVDALPAVSWPGSVLVIGMFSVVTIWRQEAALFVRCRFGLPDEQKHPMRRRADFAAAERGRLT